jgi:hypothetical protein
MRADVEIHAPPQRVWRILTDLPAYSTWNPFFVRAKGQMQPGETIDLVMQPVGKDEQAFSPKVLELTEGRRVVWRGRLFLPLLFDGTHQLIVEPIDDHATRVTQYEEFKGLFVPFVGFEPYKQGWSKMNEALKERAETEERNRRSSRVRSLPVIALDDQSTGLPSAWARKDP